MQEQRAIHPVIMFEPDGYRTDGQKLMGRQAAGQGFLRAMVTASAGRPILGHTTRKSSAEALARTVVEMDPRATAQWVQPGKHEILKKVGHLYVPGPPLGDMARQRLRASVSDWSITGITHTLSSHTAMDAIGDLVTAPVMPWDALICTSSAALRTVKTVMQEQLDYLGWRLGAQAKFNLPQLPVIPLGVHCADFATEPAFRPAARRALGIADDEVVAMFMGRLSFHAKAHPHSMYTGLQAAARRSGRKLVLIQCGLFPNEPTEQAYRSGAAMACPDVRCLFIDGRDDPARRHAWAAADFFISLSDNIQETFGLTPIEAMAAGLPVVVTDWDGYKDTVRDGIDGFRIPTWMAPAGSGAALAAAYEQGVDTYDMYCGLACQHLAVDHGVLVDRLALLATDVELRRRMGDAGRRRALESFDWAVVYRRYQDLWHDLDGLRRTGSAGAVAAPKYAPTRLDPFTAFAHYPSQTVGPGTSVTLTRSASPAAYQTLRQHPLFSYLAKALPSQEFFAAVHDLLSRDPTLVSHLALELKMDETAVAQLIAPLAKMGMVSLR